MSVRAVKGRAEEIHASRAISADNTNRGLRSQTSIEHHRRVLLTQDVGSGMRVRIALYRESIGLKHFSFMID